MTALVLLTVAADGGQESVARVRPLGRGVACTTQAAEGRRHLKTLESMPVDECESKCTGAPHAGVEAVSVQVAACTLSRRLTTLQPVCTPHKHHSCF